MNTYTKAVSEHKRAANSLLAGILWILFRGMAPKDQFAANGT